MGAEARGSHIELKGAKDSLVLAYVEQTEAQAEKRQLLEKGPEEQQPAAAAAAAGEGGKQEAEVGDMDVDSDEVEKARRKLEEAQQRIADKKKEKGKLSADPAALAVVAKKLAEQMVSKKARLSEVPNEAGGSAAAGSVLGDRESS